MEELPSRQAEILEFIQVFVRQHGLPPTAAEIQKAFGFKSKNAAVKLVAKLEARGHLVRQPGVARGLKLARLLNAALPVIGRIAAGEPILAAEHVERHVELNADFFRPRADFLFEVKGRSMERAGIITGDLVGIHAQSEARNGQIVAARLPHPRTGEDELTLKRYFRRGNVITLQAETDDASIRSPVIDLSKYDADSQESAPFSIAGIYVGLIRSGA